MMDFNAAVAKVKSLYQTDTDRFDQASAEILKMERHPEIMWLRGLFLQSNGRLQEARALFRMLSLMFPHEQNFLQRAMADLGPDERESFHKKLESSRATVENFKTKPSIEVFTTSVGRIAVPCYPVRDVIRQAIVSNRVFEPEIVAAVREWSEAGTVILDVGANFGQMSLIFSDIVGSHGKVISIEADAYVHHVLKTNLELNNKLNIKAIHAAAYSVDSIQLRFPDHDFTVFSTYGSFGLDPSAQNGQVVETIKIDSLNIDQKISFMKVDVQGCDLHAMLGAVETIKRHRMPILFEYEEEFQVKFGTSFQDYVDFVQSIGYVFEKTINRINYLIVPRAG
jgi:FkbM family methyltransferase